MMYTAPTYGKKKSIIFFLLLLIFALSFQPLKKIYIQKQLALEITNTEKRIKELPARMEAVIVPKPPLPAQKPYLALFTSKSTQYAQELEARLQANRANNVHDEKLEMQYYQQQIYTILWRYLVHYNFSVDDEQRAVQEVLTTKIVQGILKNLAIPKEKIEGKKVIPIILVKFTGLKGKQEEIAKEIQDSVKHCNKDITFCIAAYLPFATGISSDFFSDSISLNTVNDTLVNPLRQQLPRDNALLIINPKDDALLKEYFAFQIAAQQDIGKTADTMQLITYATANNVILSFAEACQYDYGNLNYRLRYLQHVLGLLGEENALIFIDNIRQVQLSETPYAINTNEPYRTRLIRCLQLLYYGVPIEIILEMERVDMFFFSPSYMRAMHSFQQVHQWNKMVLGMQDELIVFWSSSEKAHPNSIQQVNEELDIIFRYTCVLAKIIEKKEQPLPGIKAFTQQAIAATIGKRVVAEQ